jgi:hypothetical protein
MELEELAEGAIEFGDLAMRWNYDLVPVQGEAGLGEMTGGWGEAEFRGVRLLTEGGEQFEFEGEGEERTGLVVGEVLEEGREEVEEFWERNAGFGGLGEQSGTVRGLTQAMEI